MVLVIVIVPLVVFLCVKMRKKRGITIDNNDVNASLGVQDEAIINPNEN